MLNESLNGRLARSNPLGAVVRRLAYLRRALHLIWSATKEWTLGWIVVLVVQGLLPAATVYITKHLVDGVAAAVGVGLSGENVQQVLIPAVLMGSVLVLSQILQGLLGWIQTAQSELLQDHIKALLHRQAAAVDLEFYETPDYFDHMDRANAQADSRALPILQNLGGLLKNSLTLVAIAGLLIPYSVWLPLVLLLSTLPALGTVVRHNLRYHQWWRETTEKRRWLEYYDRVLTYRRTAPEVRIFDLSGYFQQSYETLRHRLRESRLRLSRNQNLANFGAGFLALVMTGFVMAWMVVRAFRGSASLGDLALFYQAFSQGQGLMRTLLGNVGQLYTDTLFLEHLFTFLELEPKVKNAPRPRPAPEDLCHGIEIEDVSFRYPGSEHLALRHFDLFIPAGETVAIVGANGAGKSTLIKLLCRFYDPEAGSVKIDGVDIRDLDLVQLRRRITVLFQDHVNYAGTVTDNVVMGDLLAEHDLGRLTAAARGSGAHETIEKLPQGFDTLLGKQFQGGTELSGGQWQRIALARAFYRRSPVVMLDEPTSFMDSWAETRWLDGFRALVKGRTAVIVTHRFTTAMRADVIHVMEEGRIVESGDHEALLGQGGLYAASWKAQMRVSQRSVAV